MYLIRAHGGVIRTYESALAAVIDMTIYVHGRVDMARAEIDADLLEEGIGFHTSNVDHSKWVYIS